MDLNWRYVVIGYLFGLILRLLFSNNKHKKIGD